MNRSLFLIIASFVLLISCDPSVDNFNGNPSDQISFNNTADGNGIGVGNVDPTPTENYEQYVENPFVKVEDESTSTFSIDADGASYANVRRFLMADEQLPPDGAVRTEELINYFELDYPTERSNHPISLNGEISTCPWDESHKLVRIGIKGKKLTDSQLGASNYVFLIDKSGSMKSDDKLDLLKRGFKKLVDRLDRDDRISIVTYAGSSALLLPSTSADNKSIIKDAIDAIGAGGSTAGAEGIITAYDIAEDNFIEDGNNRIIIGTDGDFNVGVSDRDELVELIEGNRDRGIYLTVLGVGRGNLNDAALEQIANNGNGTYEYIDNEDQLEKVFIQDFHKFYTVAKDVKVQVEFNPDNVEEYRLIGYENRVLNNEDFEDDKKDAGEIGSDQNITALYEIIPAVNNQKSLPALTIDFRYKLPDEDSSHPVSLEVFDKGTRFADATDYQRFIASVASFGMQLTDSEHKGNTDYQDILDWLDKTNLIDNHGYKNEFKELVRKADSL